MQKESDSIYFGVNLESVSITFHKPSYQALRDINLTIQPKEFVAILGASGCGKTTLLQLIAGLYQPTSGKVHYRIGTSDSLHTPSTVVPIPGDLGYVFQEPHLLPWRTVLANIELPLELLGEKASIRKEKALHALTNIGLIDFKNFYPKELSGGMKMRVSLARALVTSPKILLLDEPFSSLDEVTRWHLDEELRKIWEKENITIIFVTHSITEAIFLSNRVLFFSKAKKGLSEEASIAFSETRDRSLQKKSDFVETLDRFRKIFESLEIENYER